jgi:hypothetical protein
MANSKARKNAGLRYYRRNRDKILDALKKYYHTHLPYTRIKSREYARKWVGHNRTKWNRYVKVRRILLKHNAWIPSPKEIRIYSISILGLNCMILRMNQISRKTLPYPKIIRFKLRLTIPYHTRIIRVW